jgi:SulP family sulfate permease
VIDEEKTHHLATFGAGDFFGDMSFVDHEKRSADAVAESNVDLFILSRKRFDELVKQDPGLAADFYQNLVRVLAIRFRSTHLELRSLE